MVKEQIDKLMAGGDFPEDTDTKQLVETHISWVILCDRYVYKIKKPIRYSFLDFSTIESRRYFCERELELNKRFAKNIYLEVLPIYHFEFEDRYCIGGKEGALVDYCLKMLKLDSGKQMDVLLSENKVSLTDIRNLAKRIAEFHKGATIIHQKNVLDVMEQFNDLALEKGFLSEKLNADVSDLIADAIDISEKFLKANQKLLERRLELGFYRDCHGDLHTRNIFLLPRPQPFDCIEFNDEYRRLDVLNEVAFLCMDLDAQGRSDLSDNFITSYNLYFPAMHGTGEHRLFIYYKGYRANVRAKVNSLRARSATDRESEEKALRDTDRYLALMQAYLEKLGNS